MPSVTNTSAPSMLCELAAIYQRERKRGLPHGRTPIFLKGFTREHLAELFARLRFKEGAEIGVAEGNYAEVLCQAIPGLHLRCVDPWRPYTENGRGRPLEKQEEAMARAKQRLADFDVTYMRAMSDNAVEQVPLNSLDFVFIDGNHKLAYVRKDLDLWNERVRPGGIVAGHDYYEFTGAGVIQAVNEFVTRHHIKEWFLTDSQVRVSKSARRAGVIYRESSFFWVKP